MKVKLRSGERVVIPRTHKITRYRSPNFKANGKVYLVKCPACKKTNYSPSVASGYCAWCGYNGNGGEA